MRRRWLSSQTYSLAASPEPFHSTCACQPCIPSCARPPPPSCSRPVQLALRTVHSRVRTVPPPILPVPPVQLVHRRGSLGCASSRHTFSHPRRTHPAIPALPHPALRLPWSHAHLCYTHADKENTPTSTTNSQKRFFGGSDAEQVTAHTTLAAQHARPNTTPPLDGRLPAHACACSPSSHTYTPTLLFAIPRWQRRPFAPLSPLTHSFP